MSDIKTEIINQRLIISIKPGDQINDYEISECIRPVTIIKSLAKHEHDKLNVIRKLSRKRIGK